MRDIRIGILLFSLAALVIGLIVVLRLWTFPQATACFSILAVLASSISGYFSLTDRKDRYAEGSGRFSTGARAVIHSDRSLAIVLLQMAVGFQYVATLS